DRPLDHPPPRQQLPSFVPLVAPHDGQHPTATLPQPGDQLPRIAPIGPHQADTGALGFGTCEDQLGPVTVLDVVRMDHDTQQQTQHIAQQLPCAPYDLLARIVTAETAGPTPLDRLAIDDGRGRFVLLSFVPSHVLTQGIQDAFPDPAASPGVEVVTDRTL